MKIKSWIIAMFLLANILVPCVPSFAADENVALGKPAYASSQYNESYLPENVTDGDDASNWSYGNMGLLGSRGGLDTWVGVDLGAEYNIERIVVKSRRDADQESSRRSWVIQVSNNPNYTQSLTVGTKPEAGAFGSDFEMELSLPTAYRYVRVGTTEYNLVIAEIEVYGSLPSDEPTFTPFSDVENESSGAKANMLKKLGVLDGISEDTIGESILVTRAEAVQMISRLFCCDKVTVNYQCYSDVPLTHPASNAIASCCKLGIINPGENFYPERYVTPAEFVKILAYCMGYHMRFQGQLSFEVAAYSFAQELKLLKNTDFTWDGYINRKNAVLLLYNSLFAPTDHEVILNNGSKYQQGGTLLGQMYKLREVKGLIDADMLTGLHHGRNKTGSQTVEINGELYLDPTDICGGLLGYNVIAYVDEDDEIFWAFPERNEKIVLSEKWIEEVTRREICYNEEKRKRYSLAEGVDVIRNGVAYTAWQPEQLKNGYGRLELLDNDNDGDYEVIFWSDPQIVISRYSHLEDGEVLTLLGFNDTDLTVSDIKRISVFKNGKSSSIGRIEKHDVVFCYASENMETVTLEVFNAKAEGKIDGISDEEIVIDGETYELSEYLIDNASAMENIQPGDEVIALLDGDNRIVWFEDEEDTFEGQRIAFIQSLDAGKGLSPEVSMRVYTMDGTFEILKLANKIRIDGTKYQDSAEAVRRLSKEYFLGKFVAYESRNGLVTMLDTEYFDQDNEPQSKMMKMNFTLDDSYRYVPAANGMYQSNFMMMPMQNTIRVFDIPILSDTGLYANDSEYDSNFHIRTPEAAFGNLAVMSVIGVRDAAFYGEDEYGFPTFAVRYSTCAPRSGGVNGEALTNPNAMGMVVQKVRGSSDGYIISGLNIETGAEISISTDCETMLNTHLIVREHSDWLDGYGLVDINKVTGEYVVPLSKLEAGDIIRYDTSGGIAYVVERIFAYDYISELEDYSSLNGSYYSTSTEYPDQAKADFKLMYGKLVNCGPDILTIETVKRNPDDTEKWKHTINYKAVQAVISFDGKDVRKRQTADIALYQHDNGRVLILSRNGNNRALIAYEF